MQLEFRSEFPTQARPIPIRIENFIFKFIRLLFVLQKSDNDEDDEEDDAVIIIIIIVIASHYFRYNIENVMH